MPMKRLVLFTLVATLTFFSRDAFATQADDTSITITGHISGPTPFISQLTLTASDTSVIKSIQFTVTPKTGSVTRPLSGTYAHDYLVMRGYLVPPSTQIFLPVYGLYDGFTNTVTLIYSFLDGSSKTDSTTIATAAFADQGCGYQTPMVLQPRTASTALSYDYMLVKGACSDSSPAIIDTDGALRWVGSAGIMNYSATFFDNAIYLGGAGGLYRIDLDGTVTFLATYSDLGITFIHHNIDRGKVGVILDVNTGPWLECVNIEVDASGKVIKTWNLAEIISAAMIAGGDDPSQFVFPSPDDWFHNNAVAYNRADDSLLISSRENFLICIDYETGAIKWILGDTTKKWHQFPSLAQYALALAPGSLPPIGQHAVSVTYDENVLVLDNGENSRFQFPQGDRRLYASPRKYQIDPESKVATEVWNYEMDQSIFSPFCSSVYEDAPLNYLVDYALVNGAGLEMSYAQLLGLDASGEKVFCYQYSTDRCEIAFNSIPLHLENTAFPTAGPQALNLSTRGIVGVADNALIGGFIVAGSEPKSVALRALGPSLEGSGVSGALGDPILTLYDASGAVIATNDDWQTDSGASQIAAAGLAPIDPSESAILKTLAPAAYTVVVTGKTATPGIGLVEAYDLSSQTDSRLANISTRGLVGANQDVLISGFILGDVANATTVVRALGPSLPSFAVREPLSDPVLTIYDVNGSAIASNDNWQDDLNAPAIEQNALAPTDKLESATVLNLPAGAYSAIVAGAGGATGIALVEVYVLE